jgi:mannose-1-phosphate guanylyltransferase
MVLAAGFGTRLRPLTDTCAKPLMPVGDRPALAHVLDQMASLGVASIVVNAHHRAGDMREFLRMRGGGIEVSEEPELLGTAGGLARAAALLGTGDVLVWNADVLAQIDLAKLIDSHATENAEATLVVEKRSRGEGPVGIDEHGRIVRLRTQSFGAETHGGEFLGVSVVRASLRTRLPERGCLVGDVWIPALLSGVPLRAFCHAGPWRDIGTPGSYLGANLDWLTARQLRHWKGSGAQLAASVSLDQSILGAGACAIGAGPLVRCVVWPGACARAPLSAAIVTRDHVVRVAE